MYDLANLENLDGARLVRVYTSKEGDERVYAWFGGLMILIYDAELNEIDVFSFENGRLVESDALLKLVEQLIETHEDERFMDEDHTDDIFYAHEWNTGQDLERQQV
jgi:hypothetical protein